jgi:uncharacterized protein involved in type VI secretion and phage assembly
MSTVVDSIQAIVRQELKRVRVADLGVVEKVYPHAGSGDDDNYGCDVRLKNSGLLLKRAPVMTGHIGTAAIPNVGDLVVVVYELGDVNQPIVLGRLYTDEDRAPVNDSDEIISRLPLAADDDKTIKSAIRNHQKASPPRELTVEMPPKITVSLNDNTVKVTAGDSEMTLDQPDSSGGTVTVVAGSTQITLNQDGDLTVKAAGSMTLSADGDINLEAQNINIKSQMDTDIQAQGQATVQGMMGATLDGTTSATVQGATISVSGMTSFSPA